MSLRVALGDIGLFGFTSGEDAQRIASAKVGINQPAADPPASTATPYTLNRGENENESIDPSGDHDWYRLTVTQTENDAIGVYDFNGDGHQSLTLRDATGAVLASTDSSHPLVYEGQTYQDYALINAHLQPGTYYVDVGSTTQDTFEYVAFNDDDTGYSGGASYGFFPTTTSGVTYIGTTANDSFQGGSGNDVIFGGGGSDTLYGGMGADTMGAGSDPMGSGSGGSDATTIFGGAGDDVIYGGSAGNDFISGDIGNDTIYLYNASATAYGGQGDDTIDASAATGMNGSVATTNSLFVSGDAGNDSIIGGAVNETILGGGDNDTIHGFTSANGSDGTGTNEALFGNLGNDTIDSSSAGAVAIFGGQDNDTLSLTGGDVSHSNTHLVFGNLGNDIIDVSGGSASVYGGQGNDVITAHGGAATTQGDPTTAVHNYLSGDLGFDSITAGDGGDTLIGGAGADTLVGGAANDTFFIGNGGGDSTSMVNGAASTMNLDHIRGFTAPTAATLANDTNDVIRLQGHDNLYATSTSSHVQNYTSATAGQGGVGADFASAYAYAYGGQDSSGNTLMSHFGGNEYLSVSGVAINGTAGSLLFVNDAQHTSVFLEGFTGALTDNSVIGV